MSIVKDKLTDLVEKVKKKKTIIEFDDTLHEQLSRIFLNEARLSTNSLTEEPESVKQEHLTLII